MTGIQPMLLSNPDAALFTLLAGIFLVYTECNRPGSILPGCAGTLLILLAVNAFRLMPLRPAALALIVLGLTLLAVEVAAKARNLLAALAISAISTGLRFLLQPFAPARVHLPWAIAATAVFVAVTLALAKIALRARRNKRSLPSSEPAVAPRTG